VLLDRVKRYAPAIWRRFRLVAAFDGDKLSGIWRDNNVVGSSDVYAPTLAGVVAAFSEDLYTHVCCDRYEMPPREIVTIAVRSRGSSLSRRALLNCERIDVNVKVPCIDR